MDFPDKSRTLGDALAQLAAETPDGVALRHNDVTLDQALELIAAKGSKGGKKPAARKAAAKPAAAKTPAAKKPAKPAAAKAAAKPAARKTAIKPAADADGPARKTAARRKAAEA